MSLTLGLMDLTQSDQVGQNPPDLVEPFNRKFLAGVAIRSQWSRIQGVEAHYNLDHFNNAAALSTSTGQKWSALITAGVTTPSWVYDAGAYRFYVTEDVGPPPRVSPMPLPWDTVFQTKWFAFLDHWVGLFGSHPKFAYVVMGGFGRRAESFFVTTAADQAALDIKAITDGFSSSVVNGVTVPPGMTAWLSGSKTVLNKYGALFPNTPFICDLGAPAPTAAGNAVLQALCDHGDANFRANFAVKSDGLATNGPPTNSIGALEVEALSDHALPGFQFGKAQHGDVTKVTKSLDRGLGFRGKFVEVYDGDCRDPGLMGILTDYNLRYIAVGGGIEPPPPPPPPDPDPVPDPVPNNPPTPVHRHRKRQRHFMPGRSFPNRR